jgi:anion-transporting  ArsA/GET3 family ATPase
MSQSANVNELLEEGRLIVCAGPGGVGKTTTAAALGLRGVLAERKVIVITIDPAKRLANSLGLDALTNEPQQIDLSGLDGQPDEGELWAMMLDQKETFDEMVRRHAPDRGTVERSKDNKIYELMSSALHGMQEYAALDKLHDLYTGGYFDLVVLDTPPTTNALDFLEAPERISQFFDRRIMKWFLPDESRSGGLLGKIFNPAGTVVLKLLSKLVGEQFVEEIVEFFDTFNYLQETLKERGDMIEFILRDPQTHFLLITSADPRRIEEVFTFHEKLESLEQQARAFIVNRVTPQFSLTDLEGLDESALKAFIEQHGGDETVGVDELLDQLETHYASLARLANRDRKSIDRLAEKVGNELLQLVPILGEDVHSLEDLLELSRFLTPSGPRNMSLETVTSTDASPSSA